jgi:hypothetical protein
LGIDADADAAVDTQAAILDAMLFVESEQDFLGADGGIIRVRYFGKQDGEFISALGG